MKKRTRQFLRFRDLIFKPHAIAKQALIMPTSLRNDYLGLKQARLAFQNGYGVSVLLGKVFYSNGIDTYEVGIIKNGRLFDGSLVGECVQGRRTAKEVTAIMIRLQKLRK